VTDAWDDDDRAIARALHADDANDVDDGAVAAYETVLGYLPFAEVPPRAGLEEDVVAAALARRPAAVRSIEPARRAPAAPARTAAAGATTPARGRRPAPRASRAWIGAAAAAVAAAVVVVALVADRPGSGPASPAGRIAPASASGDLARVLAEPATRRAPLRTPSGGPAGTAALDPAGDGYVTGLRGAVPAGARRWLWLDVGTTAVRVGDIGDASVVHFVVHGRTSAVRGVIVTTAPAARIPSAPAPVVARATFASG